MTNRRTLKARTPEDLLAVVPVVLGFHPEDSVVMLTFGAPAESFHARVDLPCAAWLPEAVDPLLRAAAANRVTRAAFVLYTADTVLGSRAACLLWEEFSDAGIEVVAVLRADGGRWHAVDARGQDTGNRPYDVTAHPFAVQAVFEGAVTHRTRAALVASLAGVPEAVAGVASEMPRALRRLGDLQVPAEAGWVEDTVAGASAEEPSVRRLSDRDVARLVVALAHTELRDVAWLQIRRRTASRHVSMWTEVLRRTPEEMVAAPACLLAFAAWLAGQGALAWCALDRCREVEPDNRLATHIALALEHAVSPSAWEDQDERTGTRGPVTKRGTGSGAGGGMVT